MTIKLMKTAARLGALAIGAGVGVTFVTGHFLTAAVSAGCVLGFMTLVLIKGAAKERNRELCDFERLKLPPWSEPAWEEVEGDIYKIGPARVECNGVVRVGGTVVVNDNRYVGELRIDLRQRFATEKKERAMHELDAWNGGVNIGPFGRSSQKKLP
jgi:hypothetical protein